MIQVQAFGHLNGQQVDKITLFNEHISASWMNYGARMLALNVADRDAKKANIVLNYAKFEDYLSDSAYLNAICGRYANRIANSQFSLNDQQIKLNANEGSHHLHGGAEGFDKRIWRYAINEEKNSVCFELDSLDGDMGYPGHCLIRATFTLADHELLMTLEASCDQASIINLTSHNYYNLTGSAHHSVLEHQLHINAQHYTPVDETLIPTGELKVVANTPYDFRQLRPLAHSDIFSEAHKGYDHNFCLVGERHQEHLACHLYEPKSGRKLSIYTTEPGLQLYTGGYLDQGGRFKRYSGIALEPQSYPNSPNVSHFPDVTLHPNKPYRHDIRLSFSVE